VDNIFLGAERDLFEVVEALRKAQSVTVLTGAGVSQESGLKTFRDAQVGLWSQYKPEELATPQAFRANPQLVWDWYAMRRKKVESAKPNPGHYALSTMEDHIAKFTLATQNVDGLHQLAGSRNIFELHGNINHVKCFTCGKRAERWDESEGVPHCDACGGLLRPDVIWYGESLPNLALRSAIRASSHCDLFLSIGTSGVVQPAASLLYTAKDAGSVIVEINPESTSAAGISDFFLQGRSGEILPGLVNALWPKRSQPI
jgi:NAD-dependent protein deacetylase/lipoamidase